MLIELCGAIRVRFKLPYKDKEDIVGDTGRFNDELMDGRSFLLFNPDDIISIDMSVKKKFLDQEPTAQNPEFTWEPIPVPIQ